MSVSIKEKALIVDKRILSEFLGSAGLIIVIVGSGIMAETLAQGNVAIALMANSIATGAGLFALIQTFGPISGAHFNPAVSLVEWLWKKLTLRDLLRYSLVQILGGILGVFVTHLMFGQKILQFSSHDRSGAGFCLSEIVATFGLILVIALSGKRNVEATPFAVSLYIIAGYWCTSSTSFANPAVTIARCLTSTFSGILWTDAPGFVFAQFAGALMAFCVSAVLAK